MTKIRAPQKPKLADKPRDRMSPEWSRLLAPLNLGQSSSSGAGLIPTLANSGFEWNSQRTIKIGSVFMCLA